MIFPGLQRQWYEDKIAVVRFHRKDVRVFDYPVKRYESLKCLLWHQPNNRYTRVGKPLHDVCSECKAASSRLIQTAEYAVLIDKDTKEARCAPSSNYSMSKMSPASHTARVKRLKKEHSVLQAKVNKFLQETSKFILRLNFDVGW